MHAAPDLALEPPDAPAGQAAVALRYRVSTRTIKRWVSAGRESGHPPPLHDPRAMPAWYDQLKSLGHFKQRLPSEIAHAAAACAPPSLPPSSSLPSVQSSASSPPENPAPPPAPDLPPLDTSSWRPGEITFDDAVEAAARHYRFTEAALRQAETNNDPALLRTAAVIFREAADHYRQMSRDREKIMLAGGRLLRPEDVRRELTELHKNIPSQLRIALKSAYEPALTATASPDAWHLFVDSLLDQSFQHLADSQFASPAELAA